jgi:lipopolysaccharide transport system ATP-binding protein
MTDAVVVRDLWKSYHQRPQIGIKELLVRRRAVRSGRFAREWALQDIAFTVRKGTAFGVVGHNGTGKSTLLGLLLGTMAPDRGTIQINGRVASLLEIGAGFHPELTGRENIMLYGSIRGMSLQELRQRLDQIIEFSELVDAIDNPIRTYSNGMITRLGFSVIAHAPAEVLLIDEVLAVGDARFQQKCMQKMMQFKRDQGTIVFVSHDLESLERVCEDGVCLNEGTVAKLGGIREVIRHYREIASSAPGNSGT